LTYAVIETYTQKFPGKLDRLTITIIQPVCINTGCVCDVQGIKKNNLRQSFLLSALIIMSDQPTLDGRSKLDDQSQGSQIFDMLINTSRPTSRTSDYYSLSVTVEREDFIVDTIADRSIDYYDGSKQIKINVLVSLYGHSDPRYMAVERSFIIIRSKVYDEDDSTGKIKLCFAHNIYSHAFINN